MRPSLSAPGRSIAELQVTYSQSLDECCHVCLSWSRPAARPVVGPVLDATAPAWHGPVIMYSRPRHTYTTNTSHSICNKQSMCATSLPTVGSRVFPVNAAQLGNSLSDDIMLADSLSTFWRQLKHHLFQQQEECHFSGTTKWNTFTSYVLVGLPAYLIC